MATPEEDIRALETKVAELEKTVNNLYELLTVRNTRGMAHADQVFKKLQEWSYEFKSITELQYTMKQVQADVASLKMKTMR